MVYCWFDDVSELVVDLDVDVFVELMGGFDGLVKVVVEEVLKVGK